MLRCLAALLLFASPLIAAGSITWQPDYDVALALASQQSKVVFVAVNRDGEAGNDRMAKRVYSDHALSTLASETINLIASDGDHGRGKSCPRFGSVSCEQHRSVDEIVLASLLGASDKQLFIAPQHLFLASDGTLILSVPYEVSADELAWCFDAAWKAVDPEHVSDLPPGARPPRRLVMGSIHRPGQSEEARPLSRDEVLQTIEDVQRGLTGGERARAVAQVLTSPEEEALDFILKELRSGVRAGRGRGRRGGGDNDRRLKLVRAIGDSSPRVYWEVLAEFTDDESDELRTEIAVALEQLAAPDSVKAIAAALRKEKLAGVEKEWLRALGAAGADDRGARKTLLKAASKEKDELLRPREQAAAVCAAAMTRNEHWLEILIALTAATDADAAVSAAAEAAVKVIEGGALSLLAKPIRDAGQDTIARKRIYGG